MTLTLDRLESLFYRMLRIRPPRNRWYPLANTSGGKAYLSSAKNLGIRMITGVAVRCGDPWADSIARACLTGIYIAPADAAREQELMDEVFAEEYRRRGAGKNLGYNYELSP